VVTYALTAIYKNGIKRPPNEIAAKIGSVKIFASIKISIPMRGSDILAPPARPTGAVM
jgi:hypothetical protein